MALSIYDHSLLTTVSAASTTGTLTASPGDLAICAVFTSTATTTLAGTITGGGLTWRMIYDNTFSLNRTQIYIAPVYTTVTAQTITVSIAGATSIKGALFAVSNGKNVAGVNMGSSIGTTSVTRTTQTANNGSLVVAMYAGTIDTVISANSTQLDNNGANLATATANNSPFGAGTPVAMTATSAGGNLGPSTAFEVTGANSNSINRGLRPHAFSPGLAR